MPEELGFPDLLGPFTMAPCNVAPAINAFYSQHQFPKPDPASHDNSMAGLDPIACGLGGAEILFCQFSPLYGITLSREAKEAARIPVESTHFAWSYPVVEDGSAQRDDGGPVSAFLKYGGYAYLDASRNVVGTNGIAPAPLGTFGLMFGRAQTLPTSAVDTLQRCGRFQEVSLAALLEKRATHFAWIRPQEFSDRVAAPDGAFAYRFAGGDAKYFPLVGHPVFTPEMLEEDLEDSEAWVVVRPSIPVVEKIVMFDKAKSFDENVADHCPEFATRSGADDVRAVRGAENLSYLEWQERLDSGTITDPWILLLGTAAGGSGEVVSEEEARRGMIAGEEAEGERRRREILAATTGTNWQDGSGGD